MLHSGGAVSPNCYPIQIVALTRNRHSRKNRRTSSDNISTPNSGRSRSPSILSSDYIAEEDAAHGVTVGKGRRVDGGESAEVDGAMGGEDSKEVSMTNIDMVCKLIHELKEQDLNNHKMMIQERVSAIIVFAREKLVRC